MKEFEKNETINVPMKYSTLEKIIKAKILSDEEYLNIMLNGIRRTRYDLSTMIKNGEEKAEKEYEKTKKKVLAREEVKERHRQARRERKPIRKVKR